MMFFFNGWMLGFDTHLKGRQIYGTSVGRVSGTKYLLPTLRLFSGQPICAKSRTSKRATKSLNCQKQAVIFGLCRGSDCRTHGFRF